MKSKKDKSQSKKKEEHVRTFNEIDGISREDRRTAHVNLIRSEAAYPYRLWWRRLVIVANWSDDCRTSLSFRPSLARCGPTYYRIFLLIKPSNHPFPISCTPMTRAGGGKPRISAQGAEDGAETSILALHHRFLKTARYNTGRGEEGNRVR